MTSDTTNALAQLGAVGFMAASLMGVFSWLVKRMLDHVLEQHNSASRERAADTKASIDKFGERLGRVEQELAASRAVEQFASRLEQQLSGRHIVNPSGVVQK